MAYDPAFAGTTALIGYTCHEPRSSPANFPRVTRSHSPMWLLILLCGVIISICMGLRQTLGLFQRPMMLEAGVSAAAFGLSIASARWRTAGARASWRSSAR